MHNNIIIINLERATERKEKILSSFKAQNIEPLFYTAFDGDNIINPGLDLKILPPNYMSGQKLNNNELGCLISHIGVITTAKLLNLEYVIVLEDDVEICDNFNERIFDVLARAPKNWEYISIGSYLYNFAGPFCEPSIIPIKFRISGAYSYIIKNTAYNKIINRLSNLDTTADDILENLIVKENKLKSYVYFPFLIYPRTEDSFIREPSPTAKNIKHPSYKFFKR